MTVLATIRVHAIRATVQTNIQTRMQLCLIRLNILLKLINMEQTNKTPHNKNERLNLAPLTFLDTSTRNGNPQRQ